MKTKIIITILFFLTIACTPLTNNTGIVCDPPYIRHAQDCCLDVNEDNICDEDKETEFSSWQQIPGPIECRTNDGCLQAITNGQPENIDEGIEIRCSTEGFCEARVHETATSGSPINEK